VANIIEVAKAGIAAYNEKNWDKVKEILTSDATYDEKGTHRHIDGSAKIIEAWQGWGKAFPDSRATFVREFASGDTAILEIVWKGTHSGPLQMPDGVVPASNKALDMPACHINKIEGDKIKSISHYFDMLTMLTQIGVVKG
jgi:steroid delta-isomerase-like uncharacterized protein